MFCTSSNQDVTFRTNLHLSLRSLDALPFQIVFDIARSEASVCHGGLEWRCSRGSAASIVKHRDFSKLPPDFVNLTKFCQMETYLTKFCQIAKFLTKFCQIADSESKKMQKNW